MNIKNFLVDLDAFYRASTKTSKDKWLQVLNKELDKVYKSREIKEHTYNALKEFLFELDENYLPPDYKANKREAPDDSNV